jgi:replication fork protection complex subunit Tof1/Swi1
VLGDEALATLKDLRKWLTLYDQRHNRYDVARCLAEANIVEGDLLEILALWPEDATDDKLKHKLALACGRMFQPLLG